ncbi:MAG: enoyl-CoA hydratase [Gammaproteobacteria bacterium]|jgi:enoyl-CoA hydratase/carnithine racemase|nr:enoyl-CoA hydratase [Gammaproteobacteria bacterium]MDP6080021.1 enoyl-CoA hydratase-related protein [Arenicellales bacterium]|tara:strand:- start:1254 stop:2120 length:867 start_codon:yes stop_codon:yes gene_type:complete
MTEANYTDIAYETIDSAAVITLSRPKQMNAITAHMGIEVRHALARAEDDKNVVGIIITGAGKAFSAGADMKALQQIGQAGGLDEFNKNKQHNESELHANPGNLDVPEGFSKGTYSFFASISKPIIAAVNGPVAGAAMSIILSADMRFFGTSGFVTSSFPQRGMVAELGISWVLPKIVGPDNALDILWSSRKIFGNEAKELKLATRVYPDEDLLEESVVYINHLAENCSPVSIATMKGQVYRDLFRDPTESFKEAHRITKAALKTEDFIEGVKSFMEGRKPHFPRIGRD